MKVQFGRLSIKQDLYYELVVIVFLSALPGNFANYIKWCVIVGLCSIEIWRQKGRIANPQMIGGRWYASFLAIGLLGGLLGLFDEGKRLWPFVRDMILVSLILFVWLFSVMYSKRNKYNTANLWKTVFTASGLYSLYELLNVVPKLLIEGLSFSSFISGLNLSQWAITFCIFLFLFPQNQNGCYLGKMMDKVLFFGACALAVLSFSRTTIILLFCMVVPFGSKAISRLIKFVLPIALIMMVVYSMQPDVANTFLSKVSNSLTEISGNKTQWSVSDAVVDWRGYELYCAKRTFEDYNLLEKLVGKGFGATVTAPYAYLITSESTLPFLHNGFYTALIKDGLIGVALYIAFFASQWWHICKQKQSNEKSICTGIILGLFITSYVVQGVYFGTMFILPLTVFVWLNRKNC